MWTSGGVIAFTLFVAAAGMPAPAQAQIQQKLNWCIGKDGATPNLQISGCTAIIQSGKFSGNELGILVGTRGNAYAQKKNYDLAIADYSQAIRLDPKDAAVFFFARGNAYFHKKDYDRAITDYSQAIRLDPKDARYLFTRGIAKKAKGDAAGAEADIARAKQLQPGID